MGSTAQAATPREEAVGRGDWLSSSSLSPRPTRLLSCPHLLAALPLPPRSCPDTGDRTTFSKNRPVRDLPAGPVAKTLHSLCKGPDSVPAQGTGSHMPLLKIPHSATGTRNIPIDKIALSERVIGKIKKAVRVCGAPWRVRKASFPLSL